MKRLKGWAMHLELRYKFHILEQPKVFPIWILLFIIQESILLKWWLLWKTLDLRRIYHCELHHLTSDMHQVSTLTLKLM